MLVLHGAGINDPLVKIQWQNKLIDGLRVNGCGDEVSFDEGQMHVYKSKSGNDVVTYSHDGGHEIPEAALPLIMNSL